MKKFIKNITRLDLPIAVLLLLVSVALWVPDFINSLGQSAQIVPILFMPHAVSCSMQPVAVLLLSFGLCIINALLLLFILYISGEFKERTAMPVVLFLFMSGAFKAVHFMLAYHIGLLLMILVLILMIQTFRKPDLAEYSFLATLILYLAAIFVPDLMYFIPFLWLMLIANRALSAKTLIASWLALGTVFVFLLFFIFYKSESWQYFDFENLLDRYIIQPQPLQSFVGKVVLLVVAILLSVYYFLDKSLLNIKQIIVFDEIIIVAVFVLFAIVFPSSHYVDDVYPMGVFVMSALATHYFIASPSVVRGVMFLVYLFSQIIYWVFSL
ncbi:MAG: hypothetical protein IKN91_08185 [Paludibacteraceae bacterium]|nr:hypothetical protein [Paludibacteraceae bacterium]